AVHPDPGPVIDGAEVQENALPALAPARRDLEGTVIPEQVVPLAPADAAERALEDIRHLDSLRKATLDVRRIVPALFQALVSVVGGKVPGTVEVQPLGPHELRAWIFRTMAHHHVSESIMNLLRTGPPPAV